MSHYTEEEQIAQIKDWWSRNGKPLLTGGVLAVAMVFGWQGWQKHQTGQQEQLSAIYQHLLEKAFNPEGAEAGEVVGLLQKLEAVKPDHAYTQYARLLVARVAVQDDRLDDAGLMLRAVVNKPANPVLGELARQRLARVLATSEQTEQALALLDGKAPASFQAARDELRGDLLVQLGRTDEARKAYEQARDQLSGSSAAGALMMKLDDLNTGDA